MLFHKAMPCNVAGSAIAQGPNVGRIDRWSEWEPTSIEPLWLLLSGASDPPKDVQISDRRPRDNPGVRGGEFLSGVTPDLANMEGAVGSKLFNTVKDLYLTKSRALEHISSLFDKCKRKKVKPMLYYTGHGEIGTGNWCFHDGTISIQEIFDMLPGGAYYPMIFSDACYSGHWANFCCEKNIASFHCLAACPDFSTAVDTRGEGGDLTLFMTGKKERPSTEPMYSGGNIGDYPISSGYDSVEYTDFISSFIRNSQNILVSQIGQRKVEMDNGKSYSIYSLACDENLGFGVFFMENYGSNQTIVRNVYNIKRVWEDGFKITACAARGSTFYVIMTKDTEEYKGKIQVCFTCVTWAEAQNEIQKVRKEGKAITGICYSTGLEQYFVVMTESSERQTHKWFGDGSAANNWADKQYHVGYHPTVIFKDPTDNKILVVMTTDKNRSSYTSRINYRLK
ncbi:hypothetical protein ACROYT_G040712 [Oculina patagonica]